MSATPELTNRRFDRNASLRWWRSLQPDAETGRPGDRAALAQLRRCTAPTDVYFVPAFETLVRTMPEARVDDLAVIAAVLAHVRQHEPGDKVAQQIAATDEGGQPAVSPARFRRLLQIRGHEARLREGVRLVRQLKGRINAEDLADTLYWWDVPVDPAHPDREVQRRWARLYYAKIPAELLKTNS